MASRPLPASKGQDDMAQYRRDTWHHKSWTHGKVLEGRYVAESDHDTCQQPKGVNKADVHGAHIPCMVYTKILAINTLQISFFHFTYFSLSLSLSLSSS